MRTLDAGLITELGLTITRPGYLVMMGFNVPMYYSTFGPVTWGGHNWISGDVKVDPIVKDRGLARSGKITLANLDNFFTAILLNEGVSDKPFEIYAVYAGAPDSAVLELAGVGDAVEIGDRASIGISGNSTQKNISPRRRISPATGFTRLLPPETVLHVGGVAYTLERGK